MSEVETRVQNDNLLKTEYIHSYEYFYLWIKELGQKANLSSVS
jgi:hypothetical protein